MTPQLHIKKSRTIIRGRAYRISRTAVMIEMDDQGDIPNTIYLKASSFAQMPVEGARVTIEITID